MQSFDADFFTGNGPGYQAWMDGASRALDVAPRAYSGASPQALADLFAGEVCPPTGLGLDVLQAKLGCIAKHSIQPWHANTAAHLHTPVLLPALAAEAVITALNQSMDSFDQAPAATVIELQVVEWLCRLVGLPHTAGGTFTAGGTQSNYMGLLLARDHFCWMELGWPVREKGLPPLASRMRFLCSEMAHFSVEKSAIQLGLGTQAVVKVGCDREFRMRPELLRAEIANLREQDLLPVAIVATAGTTDFGSIDGLPEIAKIAKEERVWLHVDAAYGGALLLSPRQANKLAGIEQADSVTVDFHKAFFQPISCSAFLLADEQRFDAIRVHADYLNAESREAEGIPDLVTRSLLTTRRFDALKLWLSLQAIGRERYAAMIDRLVELAQGAAEAINRNEAFELVARPQFGAVVFRFRAGKNAEIPQRLFDEGKAVVGHTVVHGKPCLKLTLCNPVTSIEQVEALLALIAACGERMIEE